VILKTCFTKSHPITICVIPACAAGADIRTNYNLQDAAILNVIRACDSATAPSPKRPSSPRS
jgi:hypothetical protein